MLIHFTSKNTSQLSAAEGAWLQQNIVTNYLIKKLEEKNLKKKKIHFSKFLSPVVPIVSLSIS